MSSQRRLADARSRRWDSRRLPDAAAEGRSRSSCCRLALGSRPDLRHVATPDRVNPRAGSRSVFDAPSLTALRACSQAPQTCTCPAFGLCRPFGAGVDRLSLTMAALSAGCGMRERGGAKGIEDYCRSPAASARAGRPNRRPHVQELTLQPPPACSLVPCRADDRRRHPTDRRRSTRHRTPTGYLTFCRRNGTTAPPTASAPHRRRIPGVAMSTADHVGRNTTRPLHDGGALALNSVPPFRPSTRLTPGNTGESGSPSIRTVSYRRRASPARRLIPAVYTLASTPRRRQEPDDWATRLDLRQAYTIFAITSVDRRGWPPAASSAKARSPRGTRRGAGALGAEADARRSRRGRLHGASGSASADVHDLRRHLRAVLHL